MVLAGDHRSLEGQGVRQSMQRGNDAGIEICLDIKISPIQTGLSRQRCRYGQVMDWNKNRR